MADDLGTIAINADGSITPSTAPISTVDNTTYTLTGNINGSIVVERDNILLNGTGYTLREPASWITPSPGSTPSFPPGIDLSGRTNVTVQNIQVNGLITGIELDSSSNNTISGCNVTDLDWSYAIGILLSSSSHNIISRCNVTDNDVGYACVGEGIVLEGSSSDNRISGNNITENGAVGIGLTSENNIISGNNIENNGQSLDLRFDVKSYPNNASNNMIYQNNFIGNRGQAPYIDSGCANSFDAGYPAGGNFWSDYNGTDLYSGSFQNETGSDGIADTPRVFNSYDWDARAVIDSNNIDRYPLMIPRGPLPTSPCARFYSSFLSTPTKVGQVVTFNASYSVPGWNETHTTPISGYYWNFGDGNVTEVNSPIVLHTFNTDWAFDVTLTVVTNEGSNSSQSETIQIWMPSFISISTTSPSTLVGFAIDINGTLSDIFGRGLQNQTVLLSYTFPGANDWFPMTSDKTNSLGGYSAAWIPSATGYFTLKAEWPGNATHLGANSTVSLSTLRYENECVFSVESNSTVTTLSFNSTNSELTFQVSGEKDTTGYAKVTLAKSLVKSIVNIKVYLDGTPTSYSAAPTDDSWTITSKYTHSTHFFEMDLASGTSVEQPASEFWIYIGAAAAILIAVTAAALAVTRRRKHKQSPD